MTTETLDPIHDDDNLTIEFTVTENGSAVDLTGATTVVTAKNASSGTLVTLSSAVSDGPGGAFTADITPGDLTAGVWTVQGKVTLASGEIQTPLDRILTVKQNH